jgi:hypothetical protein
LERVGGQSRGAFGFALIFLLLFLSRKKVKRIQTNKTSPLGTFDCPSHGKSALIESFEFLLTFWHCPKK